jgi:hypothetical protein
MGFSRIVLAATAVASVGLVAVALAGGRPPPTAPAPDPPASSVMATESAVGRVRAPRSRTDASIDRAVRAARMGAVPSALTAARTEAGALVAVAGLRPGRIVGVRRDVSPLGYWGQDEGRFGPGVWCGRLYTGRRTVTRPDGSVRRVNSVRHGCQVPKEATVRITVTFAAEPAA